MPIYQKQGIIPPKRHTVFSKPGAAGSSKIYPQIYYEELISREGFSSVYSNLYHLRMPTRVKKMGAFIQGKTLSEAVGHSVRHVKTFEVKKGGDAISARMPLFFNSDVVISKAHPNQSMSYLYRNGHFDELLYIQSGSGVLKSQYGDLVFKKGDYLVIPRGVVWKLEHASPVSLLVVESVGPIQTPKRYRNQHGQLLEHSPYCERDIRTPVLTGAIDQEGDFLVRVKLQTGTQDLVYAHHPFDVVGWDGFHFPWAFNIGDFEPVVGSIHQPPPVHQTFEAPGFVVCSFVSRLFDFHPHAIPAPYPHSNVDSDEILFYSEGNFMSRKGIFQESITYHPMGLPHGPQPGRYEESIGKKSTEELAVMIDTFQPLKFVADAEAVEDKAYPLSWME